MMIVMISKVMMMMGVVILMRMMMMFGLRALLQKVRKINGFRILCCYFA